MGHEPELETALDQQLLFEHAVQDVAPLLLAERLAAIGCQRLDRALILLEAHQLAVDARHRAVGQPESPGASSRISPPAAATSPTTAPIASQTSPRFDEEASCIGAGSSESPLGWPAAAGGREPPGRAVER